ncbi:MAG: hypothetical protein PHI12_08080 [Dehalococcoidales bacterium]|jgi:hypothetical protein|nr:hypothetical protein [Sphaerochaeta sp.]MDD5510752.1 hypothetical protein [Dehalococcoidales bacterium]
MVGERLKRLLGGSYGQVTPDSFSDERLISSIRGDQRMRRAASDLLGAVRLRLAEYAKGEDPPRVASAIRNSQGYPPAAKWLADLEWQLSAIADGDVDEIIYTYGRE